MSDLVITVTGAVPAPQGSKSISRSGVMYEANPRLKPWRSLVTSQAMLERSARGLEMLLGPVEVEIIFTLPKPKTAGRFAQPDKKPDVDKLSRAVLDGLTEAAIWKDDGQVVKLIASKVYPASGLSRSASLYALDQPGAVIIVRRA